jgi:hypothetical protein
MEKMPCIISGIGHPKKIATETTIKIGDDILVHTQIMTVPAKWRLASEEITEETIGMTIREAANNAMIIETRQVLVGKITDRGFRGHTIYHPKIF